MDGDTDHKEDNNDATLKSSTAFLQIKKKKRRRATDETAKGQTNTGRSIGFLYEEFISSESIPNGRPTQSVRTGPLVIPAITNQLTWKKQDMLAQADHIIQNESYDAETAAAIQALQEDAGGSTTEIDNRNARVVIAAHANTFVGVSNGAVSAAAAAAGISEQQQYRQDLEALPAALDESAHAYQRVPIAEFGAALLRGMGWKDEEDEKIKRIEATTMELFFPAPIDWVWVLFPRLFQYPIKQPKMECCRLGRPRRPDQFRRDKAVQQQHEIYRLERERRLVADKQQTLQNGSLVVLTDRSRARIVKLMGVPGLNMVQLERERDNPGASVIKRNEIDRLLSRQELEEVPFKDPTPHTMKNISSPDKPICDGDNDRRKDVRKQPDDDRGSRNGESSKKIRKEEAQRTSWIVPNIRVRIVTEKLGRRFYKEKGVVVDVTRAGITLQLSSGTLLDQVPERYLETALPKAGGNVIVLAGPHRFTKGSLLERDSHKGVVQVFEDMSCLTMPLDDVSEWCGPLDDDIR